MIPFEHFQNEMAINEVQPPHSRQRKTEYMDLKEVPTSGSKRNEEVAPGTPQLERSSLGADTRLFIRPHFLGKFHEAM